MQPIRISVELRYGRGNIPQIRRNKGRRLMGRTERQKKVVYRIKGTGSF